MSVQNLSKKGGPACGYELVDTPDLKRGVDLCLPDEQSRIEARAGRYTGMHVQIPCFSWSQSLSLPPGGDGSALPPVGPYRSPDEPNGVSGLPARVKTRVENSNTLKQFALRLAYRISVFTIRAAR